MKFRIDVKDGEYYCTKVNPPLNGAIKDNYGWYIHIDSFQELLDMCKDNDVEIHVYTLDNHLMLFMDCY